MSSMHISWAGKAYKFDGCYFEVHRYFGPAPLNKNGEASRRPPGRKFWRMWEKFERLSVEEKQKYCVWQPPSQSFF